MAEYLAPGVYVEEISCGVTPIEGVATSVAGFVGVARNGPAEPTIVTSVADYARQFEDAPDANLGHAVRGFFENGGQRCYVVRVPPTPELTPKEYRRALKRLHAVEDVTLVVVPDAVRAPLTAVASDAVIECERRGDRFAILATPQDADVATVAPARASSFCATYFPWVRIRDSTTVVPPVGHVAGMYARTDTERGVWKNPAGDLAGVVAVDRPLDDTETQALHERRVNPIVTFGAQPGTVRVWGARTSSPDPAFQYVAIRRFAIFLERSIARGTQWVVFEPNQSPTWVVLRGAVESFLHVQWQQGALHGTVAEQAFFVRCDETTTTRHDVRHGRLICVVGVVMGRPGEFTILRFVYEMRTKRRA